MTTDYSDETHSRVGCPIVYRCLSQLIGISSLLLVENAQEIIDGFKRDYNRTTRDHGQVGLRGFVAIELMLDALRTINPDRVPNLPVRSWQGLTDLKCQLQSLTDTLQLDLGELLLNGVRPIGTGAVAHSKANFKAASRYIQTKRLMGPIPLVIDSICMLRRYLGNEGAPIAGVGSNLFEVQILVHAGLASTRTVEVMRTLLDAKL